MATAYGEPSRDEIELPRSQVRTLDCGMSQLGQSLDNPQVLMGESGSRPAGAHLIEVHATPRQRRVADSEAHDRPAWVGEISRLLVPLPVQSSAVMDIARDALPSLPRPNGGAGRTRVRRAALDKYDGRWRPHD